MFKKYFSVITEEVSRSALHLTSSIQGNEVLPHPCPGPLPCQGWLPSVGREAPLGENLELSVLNSKCESQNSRHFPWNVASCCLR